MSMEPPVPPEPHENVPQISAHDAERILQLTSEDSRAAEAVRGAYRGRHAVEDALWWRAHPLSAAPSGLADPAIERGVLQAEAYSRAGAATADVEIADPVTAERVTVSAQAAPLFRLERQLEADAEALDRAIHDARHELDRAEVRAAERRAVLERAASAQRASRTAGAAAGAAVRVRSGNRDTLAPDDEALFDTSDGLDADETEDLGPRRTAESWRKRSRVWMWTTVAFGVLLLGGIGLVVVQQVAPGATPGFALLSGATATGIPTPTSSEGGTTLGLTIFEDPTLAPSIPPANIDPYYQPDSLRLLGVANTDLTVYAVENRINQPCLLAVYTDGTQSATCVTKDEFQSAGIELRITNLRVNNVSGGYPYQSAAQDVVFWNPDGSYGVSSTPQKSPTSGPAG